MVRGGLGPDEGCAVDPGVDARACVASGTAPTGATTQQTGGFPSA